MSVDRTPPGGGTTRQERDAKEHRRWWVWPLVLLVLLVVMSVGVGIRVAASAEDGRFVAALKEDDPQEWWTSLTDEQLAASGRAECASMRKGDDPQSRIDFYSDFNAAYLVNDAMTYLCTEQLQR